MHKIIEIMSPCVKNKIGVQIANMYTKLLYFSSLLVGAGGQEAKTRVGYFCFFRFADMALSASMAA